VARHISSWRFHATTWRIGRHSILLRYTSMARTPRIDSDLLRDLEASARDSLPVSPPTQCRYPTREKLGLLLLYHPRNTRSSTRRETTGRQTLPGSGATREKNTAGEDPRRSILGRACMGVSQVEVRALWRTAQTWTEGPARRLPSSRYQAWILDVTFSPELMKGMRASRPRVLDLACE